MKVGTDGVLLGAWAELHNSGQASEHCRILDIGSGTGLIALMLAQRFPAATIAAVELDAAAAEEAALNFSESPWAHRLSLYQGDIGKFRSAELFDLVVANPPFFVDSLHGPYSARNAARHTASLPTEKLLCSVNCLLADHGTFCAIVPWQQHSAVINQAQHHQLHVAEICDVRPTPEKPAHRTLLNFQRIPAAVPERSQIVVESSRHNYSAEFSELTKAFYLRSYPEV